ncbi:MAG: DUF4384 domain-containing protein [Pseudomonadota bacterium]
MTHHSTEHRRCRIGVIVFATLCIGLSTAAEINAQERTNPVPVARSAGDVLTAEIQLYDEASQSWATIHGADPQLAEGERVAICATATRAGYVSVWSRTLDGKQPERVFPNDYTPEDRALKAGKIAAGEMTCFGDEAEGYGFRVTPPLGNAEVYLHWSPDLQGQFGPEDIPQIPDHGAPGASRGPSSPYSAATLSYSVIRQ